MTYQAFVFAPRAILIVVFCMLLAEPLHSYAGAYPKIESSFNMTGLSSDPVVLFDYVQTDIKVAISQPDSSTVTLPAFYDGGTTWRVRHTPTMPGSYTIIGITLNGSPASFSNLQPTNWVVTGFPTRAGFVRVDTNNPRRFVTSNGRRFFPIGHNVAWGSPSYNITNIFAKMGAAHENWSRVWMTHFYDNGGNLGWNLDWPKVGGVFGRFDLAVATNWDAIVAAADAAGIHFQMTLQHHGQYSTSVDANWNDNPYRTNNGQGGFLLNATNFFTDATAKSLTKRKLRYAIARWGYSPGIMAWELFNEVQFTDAAGAGNPANGQWGLIQAWHNEMALFLHSQDPYQHLVTSSSVLDRPLWDETDYYQHHEYPNDLISGIRDAPDITASQPGAPDFSGECGINFTAHVGISPPVWAGLMAAQSGGAMPWYWDTNDFNNDYYLIQAAADFVAVSGLADHDVLFKSSPQTTVPGGTISSLVFAFGGTFETNKGPDKFTVGSTTPDGVGLATPYLQGNGNRSLLTNGYTFFVNYPSNGMFSSQILQIAKAGANFQMFLDGVLKTNRSFPSTPNDVNTNLTISISVSNDGPHTIKIYNSGADWVRLGNITMNPYAFQLAAYAIGNSNFYAAWLWHRTNVYRATPGPAITGTVAVAGLHPGTYSGTWWDTFAGTSISNFSFTVSDTNPVTINTPSVLRSVAFYAGLPAQAGVTSSNLMPTAVSNSPSFNLPLTITNGGGLPLAYSLSFTSAVPAWLSFSSTNGYVPKSGVETVYLAFNPAGLAPGTYNFTIFVNTSDPLLPVTAVPVSLTISSGIPAAPQLHALSVSASEFVFQIQGDTNVPYIIQNSTNLGTWTSVSTNTLPGGVLNITNPTSPGPSERFWRALWQP